jgi:hypothetical protein
VHCGELVCKTGPKCSYRNTNLIYKCRSPDRLTFLQEHSRSGVSRTGYECSRRNIPTKARTVCLGGLPLCPMTRNVPGGTSAIVIVCASGIEMFLQEHLCEVLSVPAGTLIDAGDLPHLWASMELFLDFGQ